jgi:hypothetical protein
LLIGILTSIIILVANELFDVIVAILGFAEALKTALLPGGLVKGSQLEFIRPPHF